MIKVQQAVIFAGGRGERLKPFTDSKPKPLVEINGTPFIDFLLHKLIDNKIKKILFLTGYKGKLIKDKFKNFNKLNIDFSHLSHKALPGTRLLKSIDKLDPYFLLLYCDNYWDCNLPRMINNLKLNKFHNSVTIFKNLYGTGEYGYKNNILYDKSNHVIDYDNKKNDKHLNGLDIGYFIINKKDILNLNIKKFSNFNNILHHLIMQKKILAFKTNKQYHYITTLKSLNNFANFAKLKKIKHI